MNVRQTNLTLRIITVMLAAGVVLSLWFGFTTPLVMPSALPPAQSPVSNESRIPRLPPIDSYTPIFARSLQTISGAMALAPPPTSTDPQSTEAPALISQLSLVGTIGSSVAFLKLPDGSVGMVETGDDVNGSPVLAVRPSECDLRVNGKLVTLKIAPPPDLGVVVPSK